MPFSESLLRTVFALILLLVRPGVAAAVAGTVRNLLRKCDVTIYQSWAVVVTRGLSDRLRLFTDPVVL